MLEAWDTSYCMNFIAYLYGHQDGQDYNETKSWLLKEMDRKALAERSILQTTLLPVPLTALIDVLQCVLIQSTFLCLLFIQIIEKGVSNSI